MFQPKQSLKNSSRKDHLIAEQRKRLQEIRLQTQSQNTKLLKIQQKQRQVEQQYQNERRNMQQTLAKLSLEQQQFMNRQIKTTQQFDSQKQQIFANDRKKQAYLQQKEELERRNEERRENIRQKQQHIRRKKEQLEQIRTNIKKYQIYEEFLRDVRNLSDDFGPAEDEFSVMSILERYSTMERKKQELAEVHRRISIEKQTRAKQIQRMKKVKEQRMLHYGLKIKQLKEKIDTLIDSNLHLSSELQGQLNENGERQREFGQVIFSIRGLYLSIVGEDKQEKSILEMLGTIKEERKKLKEYQQLYTKKLEQSKKAAQRKD